MADAVQRALRAETGSAAGVPARRGRNPPHRDAAAGARHATTTSISSRSTARSTRASRTAPSRPSPPGRRKVVLATSIAETSLTIEGVRVVIDCGLARVPRYEPDVGLTRLETVRVSRAAADQRRGRAGRTEPGVCYRLWDEPQTAVARALYAAGNPAADLSALRARSGALGRERPAALAFLDPPPSAALGRGAGAAAASSARSTRKAASPTTAARLRRLPLPPRLARMVVDAAREGAGETAADIAAVLTERGLGGDDVDLTHRLEQFRRDRSRRAEEARAMAKRWVSFSPSPEQAEGSAAKRPGRGHHPASTPTRRAAHVDLPLSGGGEKQVMGTDPLRSPIRIASRRTAAAAAASCWRTAAAARSIRPRRWRASRSSWSPN